MGKCIDLHIHSNASDGSLSPEEIVDYAFRHNFKSISLTDHDTIAGCEKAIAYNRNKIQIITGIEFTVADIHRMHILGYFVNLKSEVLRKTIQEIEIQRNEQLNNIFLKLNAVNINITSEKVKDYFDSIHKHSIAETMVKEGYVACKEEAFTEYLSLGKAAYVKKKKISIEKAIYTIKEAGGIAVLAHPSHICNNELELDELLKKLCNNDLDGIEAYHPDNSLEFIDICIKMAKKYNLVVTGGSDFHGKHRKERELGKYSKDLAIPCSIIDSLEQLNRKRIGRCLHEYSKFTNY